MKKLLTLILLLWATVAVAAGTSGGLGFGSSDYDGWTVFSRQIIGTSLGNEVIMGVSFYNSVCTQTATAARNSVCQLLNPVGSGVNIVANTIKCNVGSAANVQVSEFDTARTTVVTVNNLKLTASQVPKGKIYVDNIAAAQSTWLSQAVGQTTPFAGVLDTTYTPMLKPGTGMEIEVLTQNITLNCMFYWSESPQ